MSDDALRQLEGLRKQSVERARLELAGAQRERQACLAARREAWAQRTTRERELELARREFAAASSVYELRWAALHRRGLQGALGRAVERAAHCDACLAAAERRVEQCQAELRASEVGRRALSRTLEQRAADVSRRTELRLEDEADDAFRARPRS